jgi:Nucleoside 2-deoxyribosyltransferase like
VKVFLGGTCNDSAWRNALIPMLKIDYYNPVVADWTLECQEEELQQRKECDYCLYVITPKMSGVYSIAELVDDSNKRPSKTIFCFLLTDGAKRFSVSQIKSMHAVAALINSNGATTCNSLDHVAEFLNYLNSFNGK